jgi:alanine racemase
MPSTIAEVNLEAIRANLRAIRAKVGEGVRIMAVVKANAYGHGAARVAFAALDAGADIFGVAHIEEAVELRDSGITTPILILGMSSPEEAPGIVANDVTASVCDMDLASALASSATSLGRRARIHVKVDTGMGRIGVRVDSALGFTRELSRLPSLSVEGIFTHFPCSDEEDTEFTTGQIGSFRNMLDQLSAEGIRPPIAHSANSGAVLDYVDSYFDMVRPGLLMYGCYPSPSVGKSISVMPALTFRTRMVFIKEIDEHDSVSYGRTFRASRKTRVATIPVGYADGFIRRLSNQGQAIVGGRRVPVIGRVCMDQTMLDISDVPNARVGDEVILYGSQLGETISVEEVAGLVETAPHDVLCAIGQRVPRVYL